MHHLKWTIVTLEILIGIHIVYFRMDLDIIHIATLICIGNIHGGENITGISVITDAANHKV